MFCFDETPETGVQSVFRSLTRYREGEDGNRLDAIAGRFTGNGETSSVELLADKPHR